MRRYLRRAVFSILTAMDETHKLLQRQYTEDSVYLNDMQAGAMAIATTLESIDEDFSTILSWLHQYCEMVFEYSKATDFIKRKQLYDQMDSALQQIRKQLKEHTPLDKLEVVFLPYKADMWTSLSSIWTAAREDPECQVKVVPIPYYDIADGTRISLQYEGDRFPKELDILDYQKYAEAQYYADITLIHNPYDNCNNLTRVPECFFSSNLKKHTDTLVYSPYYTMGGYDPETKGLMLEMPGVQQADYVIAQSEKAKSLFVRHGKPEAQVLTFGSPKIDAVVQNQNVQRPLPPGWTEKLRGRKVFLLNTHLSYFPKAFGYAGSMENYGVRYHREILETFLNSPKCALIWRPHPLLKNMLKGKFPECFRFVQWFEQQIQTSDNGIVDETGDYFDAFYCSDAMLSTWSSLINEYMATGKPILIFQKRIHNEWDPLAAIDRNVNYFRFGKGGVTFTEFRDQIISGSDPLFSDRMDAVWQAFPNRNGDAGVNIYRYLKALYNEAQ